MATRDQPTEVERVACEVCLREIPRSEAIVPEACDYVAYFCGLQCYEKWKTLPDKAQTRPEPTKA